MNIAVIGRSELMFNTMQLCQKLDWQIVLIITAKEAPEYKVAAKDFESFATAIGAEYLYTPKLRATDIKELKSTKDGIDICLSVNYSGVIPDDVISLFRLGILNAHGGDLPKYRGNACQAWALINGETRIGLCIHKMIGGELDSGDIIARRYFEANINTRIGKVNLWMTESIPEMFIEAAKILESDSNYVLEHQSKNPTDALRCYPRNPDDGKINWNNTAVAILRQINASSEPYSGAFCEYEGKKMILWRAELFKDDDVYCAVAGQIASINSDGSIIVITGNGKLKITNISLDGIKGNPSDYLKSIRKRLK